MEIYTVYHLELLLSVYFLFTSTFMPIQYIKILLDKASSQIWKHP